MKSNFRKICVYLLNLIVMMLTYVDDYLFYFSRKSTYVYRDVKDAQQANEVNKDEPIKYSTSEAAKWKAIYSTSGESYYETPKIQSTVVVFSLTAFMVYFCILREENDLDEWMRDLEKTMPLQVEEAQLRAEIENCKKKGLDIKLLESRLKEVQKIREAKINKQ